MLIVSFTGMLVNKVSTSKLAIQRSLPWVKVSSTKTKEFLTVNSFCVISDRKGTKKVFQRIIDRINNIIESLSGTTGMGMFLNLGESFKNFSSYYYQESLSRMTAVLPLSAFWMTSLYPFFNFHNDSNSSLLKVKGGELSLLKVD